MLRQEKYQIRDSYFVDKIKEIGISLRGYNAISRNDNIAFYLRTLWLIFDDSGMQCVGVARNLQYTPEFKAL